MFKNWRGADWYGKIPPSPYSDVHNLMCNLFWDVNASHPPSYSCSRVASLLQSPGIHIKTCRKIRNGVVTLILLRRLGVLYESRLHYHVTHRQRLRSCRLRRANAVGGSVGTSVL